MNIDKKTSNTYLNFALGEEDYAIPLLSAKEVIAVPEVTPVASTPKYFLGIMNLRGQVITVMDLREKLGIKSSSNKDENAVIILNLENVYIGVVVDSIKTVLNLAPEDLSPPTEIGQSASLEYISYFAKNEGKLICIIDISKALGVDAIANASRRAA